MTRIILVTIFVHLILAYLPTWAQTGIIEGKIIDSKTGEEIIGANVILEGTNTGASTNFEGKFRILNVEPGTYNLVTSYISYSTARSQGILVREGKSTSVTIQLEEVIQSLDDVTIKAMRETSSDISLISEIRQSKQVVSGVSFEQIARSQDRDAAQVMSRIPGVTITDNRFVMIRGVSDRYNQVLINEAIAPSTEVDIRSFSFDLIPSSLIDRMLVYKSGSAELPGDFAGGVIKLYTQNVVNENFTNFMVGTGYRHNTTLQPFFKSQGSPTDFLGFDNGFRRLPSDFPAFFDVTRIPTEEQFRLGRSLTNNFVANETTASPDLELSYAMGRKMEVGRYDLSNLTAITYSNRAQYAQIERNLYQDFDPATGISPPQFNYMDDFYERATKVGILHNWRMVLSPNSTIEFKNMFNQLGEHQTTIREGRTIAQRPELLRNYAYRFRERSIYTGQLQGVHFSDEDRNRLSWVAGVNYLYQGEPDFRRFRTFQPLTATSEDEFIIIDPASSNLFDNSRFFSSLSEYSLFHRLDFERRLGTDPLKAITFRAGYLGEYRDRDFNSRYISYQFRGQIDPLEKNRISALPFDEYFSPDNIGPQRLRLAEGTNASDSYTGSNLLTAAYAALTIPLNRFNISAGLRAELNRQRLDAVDNAGRDLNVDNSVFVPMPFLNVSYDLTLRSLLRLAYSRTVNRPEFRELAPFLYYDFNNEANVSGNPELETARIHNVDLRYEIYPRPGESASLALFYKYFDEPIEATTGTASDGVQQFGYLNADEAFSTGIELEFRKSLSSLFTESFLRNLSLVFNSSLIYSRVDLGDRLLIQDRRRALQGQSPYVVNLGAFYDDQARGLSVNLFYNVIGPRIFRVGDTQYPTVYEMPRNVVDLTIAKSLSPRMGLRVGVQDLFNAKFRFFQDSNRDTRITEVDELVTGFRRGAYYRASVNYKF